MSTTQSPFSSAFANHKGSFATSKAQPDRINISLNSTPVISSFSPISPDKRDAKRRQKLDERVLLSDGTEVFELEVPLTAPSTQQYSRNKPYRSTRSKKNPFASVEHHVIEEDIRNEHALMEYTGCVMEAPDKVFNEIIENEYNKINNPKLYYNKLYKTNLLYFNDNDAQIRNIDNSFYETPFVKYSRMKQEMMAFVNDLNQYENEDSGNGSDNSIKMIVEAIRKLEGKLDEIRNDERYKLLFDCKYNLYESLNYSLFDLKDRIVNGSDNYGNGKNGSEAKDNSNDRDENSWKLYSKYKSKKLIGTPDREFLHFEERIAKLEKQIGFVTDMKNPFPDVMLGVTFLEARFDFVFKDRWVTVKALANKMKGDLNNIQYHLDLLLKHKHNPGSDRQKKQEMDQMRQSWQKFDELWIFMNKWDSVVFDLINIVKRMKSLENYHYRECVFVDRVNKLQNEQSIILQSLKEDNKLLQKTLKSIQDNTKQLQQNFSYLQHRIGVMEKKFQG